MEQRGAQARSADEDAWGAGRQDRGGGIHGKGGVKSLSWCELWAFRLLFFSSSPFQLVLTLLFITASSGLRYVLSRAVLGLRFLWRMLGALR